jgi:hypothetical protein
VAEVQPAPESGGNPQARRFCESRAGDFAATLLISGPFAAWLIHTSAFYALPTIAALAVGLPWWWTRLGRRALKVTEQGLEVTTLFGLKRLRWSRAFYAYEAESDASRSQGLIVDAAINLASAAVQAVVRRPESLSTKLFVKETDGVSVCIDDYAGARGIEAELVADIHRRSSTETNPFELSAGQIRHHGECVALSQVDRVVVAAEVEIYSTGARSAWASEPLPSIHNVWLLVERLLEQGVKLELGIEAPASIVASAEAAAAREATMPRATIVKE